MTSNGQVPIRPRSEIPARHGFTESQSENMLRDSILLAASFTGALITLVLQDESGTWYRDSSGLTSEQLAEIEPVLACGAENGAGAQALQDQGLLVTELLPLMDQYNRVIGTLGVFSSAPMTLSSAHREGLRLLANHIQTIVNMDRQKSESRNAPRAPSATSFVPGLVHELGSFIFGISANLDVFEARFAELDDVTKYVGNLRRSLDRMSAFIVELRQYGDPQRLSWSTQDLEPLLRSAMEELGPLAARRRIGLNLNLEGDLPCIDADEQGLRAAFRNLIDLVLQLEEEGKQVVIHVSAGHLGERAAINGHLDSTSLKFKNVDPSRLFEPFYFRVSGLGRLSLPGARRVFESHGGKLVAGPGPGEGLRISFTLPAALNHSLRPDRQP
jgi:signal transduction histidine kinase